MTHKLRIEVETRVLGFESLSSFFGFHENVSGWWEKVGQRRKIVNLKH